MNNNPCGCALRCYDRVGRAQRQKLFDGFWGMGSFDVQNTYLCGCVKVINIKRHYTSNETSRRKFSRVYYINSSGVSARICKTAFLRIHGVSNRRLDQAIKDQLKQGGVPKQDQRGRHTPANKTKEEDLAVIRQHISSFPKYKSHYSRADNPIREYLSPDLSAAKMYALYCEYCANERKQPASQWVYRKVFNEEYNLTFGRCETEYVLPYTCM